jgi:hypothetical protein
MARGTRHLPHGVTARVLLLRRATPSERAALESGNSLLVRSPRGTGSMSRGAPSLLSMSAIQEVRRYRTCGQDRPIPDFQDSLRAGGQLMRRYMCRACRKIESLARIKDRRDYSDRIKTESSCVTCGFRGQAIQFDFDHRPGTKKVANIAALITKGTIEDFVAEIAKCEVICANCHRIRTAERWATSGTPRQLPRRHRRGLTN